MPTLPRSAKSRRSAGVSEACRFILAGADDAGEDVAIFGVGKSGDFIGGESEGGGFGPAPPLPAPLAAAGPHAFLLAGFDLDQDAGAFVAGGEMRGAGGGGIDDVEGLAGQAGGGGVVGLAGCRLGRWRPDGFSNRRGRARRWRSGVFRGCRPELRRCRD